MKMKEKAPQAFDSDGDRRHRIRAGLKRIKHFFPPFTEKKQESKDRENLRQLFQLALSRPKVHVHFVGAWYVLVYVLVVSLLFNGSMHLYLGTPSHRLGFSSQQAFRKLPLACLMYAAFGTLSLLMNIG